MNERNGNMEYPSAIACLETLDNPRGRFRRLTGAEIGRDAAGRPDYRLTRSAFVFRLEWRGKRWKAECPLRAGRLTAPGTGFLCRALRETGLPELPVVRRLEREMLVFDENGACSRLDVLLTEVPEGATLAERVRELCGRDDREALENLFRAFVGWCIRRVEAPVYVHRRLDEERIRVAPDGKFRLSGYECLLLPGMKGWETEKGDDHHGRAVLTLWLYGIAAGLIREDTEPERAVGMLSERKAGDLPVPAEELLRWTAAGREALRREGMRLGGVFREMRRACFPGNRASERLETARDGKPYRLCGTCRVDRATVLRVGKYGYAGAEGRIVIPFRYDWAGDFDEGLAAVCWRGEWGVIDRSGCPVLALEHEDVCWHGDNGVILACRNGKWWVFDRTGTVLSEHWYAQIGDFSCGRAWVRRGRKYGYIDRTGRTVIPVKYDDAESFGPEGFAVVRLGDRRFAVGTDGKPVE